MRLLLLLTPQLMLVHVLSTPVGPSGSAVLVVLGAGAAAPVVVAAAVPVGAAAGAHHGAATIGAAAAATSRDFMLSSPDHVCPAG